MYLNTLSQVGILIYMFLVGAALNHKELKSHGHAAILTSHVSIIVPFFLGALLAVALYPRLSDNGVTFTGFALFMGAAMSITAFPVLARILTDRSMLGTRLGTLAIACAAVDDITGWCILAYIVVVIRAHSGLTPMWVTVGGTVGFALIMIYGVKRLLRGFYTPTGVVAHCHGDFERDERNAGIPGRKYTHPSELHFGSRGGVQWHTLSAVVGGACNCVRIPR